MAGTQGVVGIDGEEGKVRRISARKLARRGKGALATLPRIVRYLTAPIETLRPGDWVLARDEGDAEGELVLRQVEERFERTAYALVHLTLRDAAGREQVIRTTAEHPVYLLGQGWVAAGELRAGDTLGDPQGGVSVIVAVKREVHREGIAVYNLRVHQAHTYFVRAEGSDAEPVWVHNTCGDEAAVLRKNLKEAGELEGKYAAHMVPSDVWSYRSQQIADKIGEMQSLLDRVGIDISDAENGFFSKLASHEGTHTDRFINDLHRMLSNAPQDYDGVASALQIMKQRVWKGKF